MSRVLQTDEAGLQIKACEDCGKKVLWGKRADTGDWLSLDAAAAVYAPVPSRDRDGSERIVIVRTMLARASHAPLCARTKKAP